MVQISGAFLTPGALTVQKSQTPGFSGKPGVCVKKGPQLMDEGLTDADAQHQC